MRHLVLIGGGHSHVEVIRQMGIAPPEATRITLIGRERHTPYSGMLPGHIAGHYSFEQMHIDLVPLAKFARANYLQDEAVGVDLRTRRVFCRLGDPVPFDVLSINTGITPQWEDVSGAAEHALSVKPIGRFLEKWGRLVQRVRGSSGALRIGTVGGGAGGVEVLLAIQHALGKLPEARAGQVVLEYFLVSAEEILSTHNAGVRGRFARVLAERAVRVVIGNKVSAIEAGKLILSDGETLHLDEILWVTQAAAPSWIREAGFAVNEQGFIKVADTLESTSHPSVFAAGDVAAVVNHPREKAGVFAVRQGPPLTANLHRALRGEALQPFTPQRKFLSLISTGDKYAVASYGEASADGYWVWWWKDWIDRRFVRRYHRLYGPLGPKP